MSSGEALATAAAEVIANGKKIASQLLEAAVEDIEFSNGRFAITGTDRSLGIMEIAARLHAGISLPDSVPASLDASLVVATPPPSYPNGCHIAEVEIDPDTGLIQVAKYTMVNDFGVVFNPLVVSGQAHGGVMQGIGQLLMENVVFDDAGQPLAGSFMDYALPRAEAAPDMVMDFHPVPATTNSLGVKGCGEAGCAGSLPAVMSAITNALGIRHIDMPCTPERIWRAIQGSPVGR
jgi:carbon-monoxide dehydrogenase large subunit